MGFRCWWKQWLQTLGAHRQGDEACSPFHCLAAAATLSSCGLVARRAGGLAQPSALAVCNVQVKPGLGLAPAANRKHLRQRRAPCCRWGLDTLCVGGLGPDRRDNVMSRTRPHWSCSLQPSWELLAGSDLLPVARGGRKPGSGSVVEACSGDCSTGHSSVPGESDWVKERRME